MHGAILFHFTFQIQYTKRKAPYRNTFKRGGGSPAGEAIFESSVSARAPLLHNMADQPATTQRDDEQPERQQYQESFGSTKRFHIAYTSFKLFAVAHFNSQPIKTLSHMALQLYIICEVIYLMALIQVTGPASPNPIYQYLYIFFGTFGAELLLWISLSLVMWLILNVCLLIFALASSGLLARISDRFQEIDHPSNDVLISEVQLISEV